MSSSSFSVLPAELADVPAMARLAANASDTDRNTQVKAMGPNPYDHDATMRELLPGWIEMAPTRAIAVKAVDDQTGEILGWICVAFAGYTQPSKPREQLDHDVEEKKAQAVEDPLQRQAKLTSANMMRWVDILMPPGTKCMPMMSLAVSPAHQRRGVGSALMRTATQRADADGVFMWVSNLLYIPVAFC